ncbi:hypothetical protein BDN70DRAFT_899655 [Pholiota conissans]|uniref:Uncharacterized protein n=1 Tax=Pholiota conissans TaxID=109636 RepID=A0A9P5YQG5_9AGAR|nr:hypothetical protein BDN70DRAFT_899655 [Pholiota conissans]
MHQRTRTAPHVALWDGPACFSSAVTHSTTAPTAASDGDEEQGRRNNIASSLLFISIARSEPRVLPLLVRRPSHPWMRIKVDVGWFRRGGRWVVRGVRGREGTLDEEERVQEEANRTRRHVVMTWQHGRGQCAKGWVAGGRWEVGVNKRSDGDDRHVAPRPEKAIGGEACLRLRTVAYRLKIQIHYINHELTINPSVKSYTMSISCHKISECPKITLLVPNDGLDDGHGNGHRIPAALTWRNASEEGDGSAYHVQRRATSSRSGVVVSLPPCAMHCVHPGTSPLPRHRIAYAGGPTADGVPTYHLHSSFQKPATHPRLPVPAIPAPPSDTRFRGNLRRHGIAAGGTRVWTMCNGSRIMRRDARDTTGGGGASEPTTTQPYGYSGGGAMRGPAQYVWVVAWVWVVFDMREAHEARGSAFSSETLRFAGSVLLDDLMLDIIPSKLEKQPISSQEAKFKLSKACNPLQKSNAFSHRGHIAQNTGCHAPIGNYFTKFNIPEPAGCRHCASHFRSREHLLEWCHKRKHHPPHYIRFAAHLVNLLDENPAFFAQAVPYKPDGIG